jgi:hypothetical protein
MLLDSFNDILSLTNVIMINFTTVYDINKKHGTSLHKKILITSV